MNFINQINLYIEKSQFYLIPWLEFFVIMWGINILNWLCGSIFNVLGIYPRHPFGLIGIIFSPFLNRDFSHLLFNSIPLFVLGLALLTEIGLINFCWITLIIGLIGGFGVWLFARKGLHIGASGIISGYFGYILMTAYTAPGFISVLLAIMAIYYFGGIFLGLFPGDKDISWEAHLFGFIGGLCASIYTHQPTKLLHYFHLLNN